MAWSLDAGLRGKSLIVTGAAGGIGAAVLEAAASSGMRVMGTDIENTRLNVVVKSASAFGEVRGIPLDISDLGHQRDLLVEAKRLYGGVDCLVHTAAVLKRQYELSDVSESDWDLQVDANQKATFFLNRSAADLMKEQGRPGAIVDYSSVDAFTGGLGGSIAYSATKGAVLTMVRGLARLYGPFGIRINAIVPGAVDTPMFRSGLHETVEDYLKLILLGRVAHPKELASVSLFLLSEHASYITGTSVVVDGGWLRR